MEKQNDTDLYIHESTDIVLIHDYKRLDHYSRFCSYCHLSSANRIISYRETYASKVEVKLLTALTQ